jgi:hypothetical protein
MHATYGTARREQAAADDVNPMVKTQKVMSLLFKNFESLKF